MAIKLVVFDIAGTTVKDEDVVIDAFRTSFNEAGHEVPAEVISPLMGYKKDDAIRKLLERFGRSAGTALDEKAALDEKTALDEKVTAIHRGFIACMVRHYRESPTFAPFPNAEETFRRLREKDIRIGMNTGFPRVIADVIMERTGWLEKGLVDYLIASDEAGQGRPHPGMIRDMMRQASIASSEEVAKVGDTEVDIREGQNAGCRYVIGVTTGAFSRQELEPYNPTHIVDDLIEIVPIVLK